MAVPQRGITGNFGARQKMQQMGITRSGGTVMWLCAKSIVDLGKELDVSRLKVAQFFSLTKMVHLESLWIGTTMKLT